MLECALEKCSIDGIPRRLHAAGRRMWLALDVDDRLFMRHPPLKGGVEYVFEIPGHSHLADQSVNSERINTPSGKIRDVLYDTVKGQHHFDFQIACLDLKDIEALAVPNQNTIKRDKKGNIVHDADIWSFRVSHEPVPCMYPHCVIRALNNNQPAKSVSDGIKSVIRMNFADLAEKQRLILAAQLLSERACSLSIWDKTRNLFSVVWLLIIYPLCRLLSVFGITNKKSN